IDLHQTVPSTAAEGREDRGARRLPPGRGPQALENLALHVRQLLDRIPGVAQTECGDEDATGLKTRILGGESTEGAHQQTGGHDEHEGERDLANDQSLAYAEARAPLDDAAFARPHRGLRVHPGG